MDLRLIYVSIELLLPDSDSVPDTLHARVYSTWLSHRTLALAQTHWTSAGGCFVHTLRTGLWNSTRCQEIGQVNIFLRSQASVA
ncbi:hypothetical protein BPAE_0046g00580 [Botrytis paeoniae]|uniref:Uncharacterized protein n=1 Tax=Botrytis paeoniae TaxID=278948 RepID=A0A4Z1FRR4_9HELO|nr:hypothetical protein BPAE_0046g00580 [Botrytis paeoniae]